ncbi:MAG: glycosyltransferase [Clostridiales bacterium]|nr:glycosyltransferase [Clostridiales bacterium]
MNIAFLVEDPFSLGGVQRVVNNLCNELSKENIVTLICLKPELKINRQRYGLCEQILVSNPSELTSINQRYYFRKGLRFINKQILGIKSVRFLEYIYLIPSEQKKLKDYFNASDFDVVIAVQLKLSILLGSICQDIKCKCFAWQHSSFDAYYKTPHEYYWNQNRLASKYLKKMSGCVVLSNYDVLMYKKELDVSANKISNLVEISKAKVPAGRLKRVRTEKIILFVGRLDYKTKGLDFLLNIAEKLEKYISYYRFLIVGDGEDKIKLEEEVKRRNLSDKVNICEATNNVKKFYEEADLLISTSRWEGFGLTLVEAMMFGVPFVSFDNSGPRDILDDSEAGILIKLYDTEKFAETIAYVLQNEDLYLKMSIAAFERADDFLPNVISGEWLKMFREK